MFDSDIDYNAVFGIDSEAENASGEEEQEAAEPAEEEDTEGAEEQEVAETADDAGEEPDDTDAEGPEAPAGSRPKGKKDSVYAAARRRAEAEMNGKLDEIIKGYNWKDPYTGKPITSKAEYDQYLEKFNEDQRKKVREKSGMSDEQYDDYIAGLPEVKEARRIKEEAQQAQIQQQISEELRQISELDPSVHTVSDVLSGESGEQIRQSIARGMTLIDAFKLANFDRLRNGAAEGERIHAGYNAMSKAHLGKTRSRGQGMAEVPKETKEYYKVYFPHMSDSDIQKEYNKWEKQKNGG